VAVLLRFSIIAVAFVLLGLSFQSCSKQPQIGDSYIQQASALRDSGGTLDIDAVIRHDESGAFTSLDEFELDDQAKVIWLRLQMDTSLIGEEVVLPIRHVDSIFTYSHTPGGMALIDLTGEDVKMRHRKIDFGEQPSVSFEVPATSQVYLKLLSSSLYSRSFRNLKQLKLERKETFLNRVENARYFHGIFFGVMLAMIIYNLFIYFIYRDFMYVVYTIFIITQTLYHLSITGFLRELVLPDQPFLAKNAPYVIAGVSLLSYIWFSQVYLNAKEFARRLNKVLNALYFVVILTTLTGLFYKIHIANSILLICGLLAIAFPLVIAIIAYRKKYRPAYFFLIASILAYIGYYLFTMQRFELIPSVFVTRYSYQIMFAGQSLLFALGLGDRMNRIRKELALGKIKQAELKREKETALKEVLEKQNIELEQKVAERTKELVEKSKIVERDKAIIQQERQKSEALLLNILPESIAARLKGGEYMIADQFDEVSVFFSDIVGFTRLSKELQPNDLIALLNDLFSSN
jgi:hypothetical protein